MEVPHGGRARAPLAVRIWGARGTVPVPGPATALHGGNTACVEVIAASGRVILDAGTGIRGLGRAAAGSDRPLAADILLTHYHWDHIQGLPCLDALADPGATLRIRGPGKDSRTVERVMRRLLSPLHFPLTLERVAARLEFCATADTTIGGIEVAARRIRHPGVTFAYRLEAGGSSVAYAPDHELGIPGGSSGSLKRFLRGVDLLVHDAMWTESEYAGRRGWGHSSVGQAVRLAEEVGAGTLSLFHHAPDRTDAELERLVETFREDLARRGSSLRVRAAREGEELEVGPLADD